VENIFGPMLFRLIQVSLYQYGGRENCVVVKQCGLVCKCFVDIGNYVYETMAHRHAPTVHTMDTITQLIVMVLGVMRAASPGESLGSCSNLLLK
jgi:hypothetical protein